MSVELAIQRLREQQSRVKERSPQRMVAKQLRDLLREATTGTASSA